MPRLGFMFGVGAAVLVAATQPAAAETTVASEQRPALEWKPTWTRFRTVEYVATPVMGGLALYRLIFTEGPDHPRWTGPILVDGDVRDGMRVRSSRALANVRLAGDIATIAPVVHVLLIDSLLVPAIDGNADVAWQLTAMNAEAFAASGLVVGALFDLVARARPSYDECEAGTTDDKLCNTGKYADFPSGHTATAFTAAGLTCAHHANLPLYGGGAPDVLACVASLGVATSAGVFRLIGDRHYLSDVVVGAGIGFMFGFGLPMLLHYREHPVGEVYSSAALRIGVTPGSERAPLGASAFGIF